MVQTEGGRTHGSFPPTTPLSTIMEELGVGEEREGYEPAMVYMRQQIIGREQLAMMCLKDLGLSQGKATLRFTYVKQEIRTSTEPQQPDSTSKENVTSSLVEGSETTPKGPETMPKGSEVTPKGSEIMPKASRVQEVKDEKGAKSEVMEVETIATPPIDTPPIDTPSIEDISFPVLPIGSVFGPDEGVELVQEPLQERLEPPAEPMDYTEQGAHYVI